MNDHETLESEDPLHPLNASMNYMNQIFAERAGRPEIYSLRHVLQDLVTVALVMLMLAAQLAADAFAVLRAIGKHYHAKISQAAILAQH